MRSLHEWSVPPGSAGEKDRIGELDREVAANPYNFPSHYPHKIVVLYDLIHIMIAI